MAKTMREQLHELVELRMEIHRASARVQVAIRKGQKIDLEDLVVVRGSSEAFATLAEEYMDEHHDD